MSAPTAPPSSAIVLFAHGARDPRWAAPFEAVAAAIRRASPGREVALAYLELMAPDLRDTVGRLVASGALQIDVVPLFLGTGGHLRKDLPPLMEAARAAHPGVTLRLHAAIGEHDAVVAAMAAAALGLAGGQMNNPVLP